MKRFYKIILAASILGISPIGCSREYPIKDKYSSPVPAERHILSDKKFPEYNVIKVINENSEEEDTLDYKVLDEIDFLTRDSDQVITTIDHLIEVSETPSNGHSERDKLRIRLKSKEK